MADEQQVCPNCGSFNRAGARFCSKCGHVFKPSTVAPSPAPTPKVTPKPAAATAPPAGVTLCPNCGKEVGSDTRFCRHCGHPLGVAQTSASPPISAAPAPTTPSVDVATSDDDVTQPLGVKSAPPQSAAPAKAAPHPAPGVERGAPAWLWALVGLLVGILLGAGIVLAVPGFVGLERVAAADATPTAPVTDARTPAITDAVMPLDRPTSTAEVVATVTPEPTPVAIASVIPTPEEISTVAAPPVETDVSPVEAEVTEAVTEPADAATPAISSTSTPLTP